MEETIKRFVPIGDGKVDGGVRLAEGQLYVGGEDLVGRIQEKANLSDGDDVMIEFQIYRGMTMSTRSTKNK